MNTDPLILRNINLHPIPPTATSGYSYTELDKALLGSGINKDDVVVPEDASPLISEKKALHYLKNQPPPVSIALSLPAGFANRAQRRQIRRFMQGELRAARATSIAQIGDTTYLQTKRRIEAAASLMRRLVATVATT
jgi:hypothetical protein